MKANVRGNEELKREADSQAPQTSINKEAQPGQEKGEAENTRSAIHDLNNELGVILAHCDIAQHRINSGGNCLPQVEAIRKTALTAAELARKIQSDR